MKVFKILEIKKCLYGRTQNNDGVVLELLELDIGTASEVINFNDDMAEMLRVLAKLGIKPGNNSIDYCNKKDKARIYQMSRKEMDLVKHQCKQIRAIRKGFGDRDEGKKEKT